MKNFMKTNIITHNLISFSGFKALLLFSFILDNPKSYADIQEFFINHEYLHEELSTDTIRIYLNSLREIGCKINIERKNRIAYYYISSHPFELEIDDKQTKNIIRIFKAISQSIDFDDFMILKKFFEKFSVYITNDRLKEQLINISPLSNISINLLESLKKYTQSKTELKIYYNSENSGKKYIDILAEKLQIINGKLYLYGYNSEHKNYSSFLVSKIIEIASVNLKKTEMEITVRYEYYKKDNISFKPLKNEKIIEQDKNRILVDISSKDKFSITQRILSLTNKCKVISPENYKDEILSCLKQMKEGYFGEK